MRVADDTAVRGGAEGVIGVGRGAGSVEPPRPELDVLDDDRALLAAEAAGRHVELLRTV